MEYSHGYCFIVLQDTNENYDLPVIREFNDIYYFTQDGALTIKEADPFNKQEPLPEIGQDNALSRHSSIVEQPDTETEASSRPQTKRASTNHQMTNVFKKVGLSS